MKKILITLTGIAILSLAINSVAFGRQVQLLQKNLITSTNLTAYWNFNGGSSSDYKGTYGGTDTSISYGAQCGKFGEGACFSGGYFTTGYPDFNYNTPFTVGCWFNTTTTSGGYGDLMTKNLFNSPYTGWRFFMNNVSFGTVDFQLYSGSNQQILTRTVSTYNDGKWHFAVVTYDGSDSQWGLNLYVDGVRPASSTLPQGTVGNISNAAAFEVGGTQGANELFHGFLDDCEVWNRVLSPSEIANLYTARSLQGNDISR